MLRARAIWSDFCDDYQELEMATYSELVAQIEELKKKAEQVRRDELHAVIQGIKRQMAEYGLTVEDLGGSSRGGKRRSHRSVAAKYHDPASGQSWSGRGKTPRWLVDAERAGKPRSTFAVS